MEFKELWTARIAVLFVTWFIGQTAAMADVDCNKVRHVDPVQRDACMAKLEAAWAQVNAEEEKAAEDLKAEAAKRTMLSSSESSPGEAAAIKRKGDALAHRRLIAARYVANVDLAAEAYLANHCDRPLTICYDRSGERFLYEKNPDKLPASVRSGDKVTVFVLTLQADDKGPNGPVTVTFLGRKSLETLLGSGSGLSGSPVEPIVGKALGPALPPSYSALPFVSDPVPDDAVDLTINFQRRPAADENGVDKTDVIPVELGYSYYSVAFLVAATFKGDRHILRDLSTTSDHAVDPGLALNIFPLGRQRGVIGYLRKCSSAHAGRCAANMIGFQIGTDLDLTNPTDKLYVGLVFEPVAGLALVGGVALRKVAVVPSAGALPALEAMDGSSPGDTRYVARGYVGVTITLDLLDTISSAGADIKKIKAP